MAWQEPKINWTADDGVRHTDINRIEANEVAIAEQLDSLKVVRACKLTVGTSQAGYTAIQCDYLCDGTDDEVEINAAIASLPSGGEVHILDGTYNLADSIKVLVPNITLTGNGSSTVLHQRWAAASGSSSIKPAISIENQYCTIQYLSLNGHVTTGYGTGIYSKYSYTTVHHCTFTETGDGVKIKKDSTELVFCKVYDNYIANSTCLNGAGINFEYVQDTHVYNNTCLSRSNGILIVYGTRHIISNNICTGGITAGIYALDVSDTIISNNKCSNNYTAGIYIRTMNAGTFSSILIVDNICNDIKNASGVLGDGICIEQGSTGIVNGLVVSKNFCSNCNNGIILRPGNKNSIISSNICYNNNVGIYIYQVNDIFLLNSNICMRSSYTSSQYTIHLATPTNGMVVNNLLLGKGVQGYPASVLVVDNKEA